MPLGQLEDIRIWFAHTNQIEGLMERWNLLRRKINWDNLVFLMISREQAIPLSVLKSFSDIPYKHLTIFEGNISYIPKGFTDYVSIPGINLFDLKNEAIENYFDLLGWMNDVSEDSKL